ncbi:protein EXPORTIN 1B-like [Humulus lupulus]|uniref:protein EXPORTIN 1B-like n=1 Tax=Humulus lupulus TaxID=3486 RepID=UPI002B405368|nr:protein EXPORTIN 1B-like [Humulus lupulus]
MSCSCVAINIFFLPFGQTMIPLNTNIPEAYAIGSSEEQAFIQNLALFFTSFYKSHIRVLETPGENIAALLMGVEYLTKISYVDDTEVFKGCCYGKFMVCYLSFFCSFHHVSLVYVSPGFVCLEVVPLSL